MIIGSIYATLGNICQLNFHIGIEYIEKPDLTVVFYTDIAASCVPVYANQTWSFLHMILSTGSQSLVNFVPVSPTVFYLHVYPFYVY